MPSWLQSGCLGLLLVAACCSGCDRPQASPGEELRQVKSHDRKANFLASGREAEHEPSAPSISLGECYQFAFDLEEAIRAGNEEGVNALMNWNAMLDVSAAGQVVPEDVRARYVAQHSREVADDEALLAVRKGASYSAIRIHFDQGPPAVWFRLQHTNGTLFYDEYRLGRGANGKVQACDVYNSSAGDTRGERLRPIYSTMLKYQAQGSLAGFTTLEQAIVKHHDDIKSIYKLSQRGDHADVIALYRQFPEELQQLKCIFLSRYESALKVSPKEVSLALSDADRFYGEDHSLDSLLSDYYYGQRKCREALACIDRLNWKVGGDILLSEERISILIKARDFEQARKEASLMILWAPGSFLGYRAALNVAVCTKDFDRMIAVLRMAEAYDVEVPDFASVPAYGEFIKSPQYTAWLAEYGTAHSEPWPRVTE